jgi:cell wall-associated NlpC family hydrolase
MSKSAFIAVARSYIGVRWVHQGRSRDGIDCLGLVTESSRVSHGNTVDVRDYTAQAQDETMLQMCQQHMDRVQLSEIQPADVVICKYGNQRHMAIVGDYLAPGELSLIHASTLFGKVVEHRLDAAWRRLIIAAFRLRDDTWPN